jgi:hypothetical protein
MTYWYQIFNFVLFFIISGHLLREALLREALCQSFIFALVRVRIYNISIAQSEPCLSLNLQTMSKWKGVNIETKSSRQCETPQDH